MYLVDLNYKKNRNNAVVGTRQKAPASLDLLFSSNVY